MTFWPSPSKLALAERCSYPWSLHRPKWPKRLTTTTYASVGTAISQAAECLSTWGDAPLELIAEANQLSAADTTKLRQCARHIGELLESECPTWRRTELRLALHVESGKVAEREHGDYRKGEVSGSADLVQLEGEALVVRDWKSGFVHVPVRGNRQLELYALACSRYFGIEQLRVEIATVDEGGVKLEHVTLDAFDLARIAGWSRLFFGGLGGPEEPRPGPHCREGYCPILAACPATTTALATIQRSAEMAYPPALSKGQELDESPKPYPLTVEIESHEQAAEVHRRLKLVTEATRQIRAAVDEYVRAHGPVPLEGDRVLAVVEQPGKERVDLGVDGAWSVVQHHLGAHAEEAVELSTSKKALEAAARKDCERGELRGRMGALLDDLRRAGALRQGAPSSRVDEVVRKEAAE